jgi:multicomponent Na+:H+ antiporter subunit D
MPDMTDWVRLPWPALVVIVPLAAGLVSVVVGSRSAWLGWAVTVLTGLTVIPAVIVVLAGDSVALAVGGWAAPLGIQLQIDGFSAAFLLVTLLVAGTVSLLAPGFLRSHGKMPERQASAFWPLHFLMWAALNALFVSADLFNVFVALELLTLTAVAMVALGGGAASLAAAMRYLLFAMAGALAFLLAVMLLYVGTGTVDFTLLGDAAVPVNVQLAAGALLTAGLLAKTALFPLHVWLAPAHSVAPSPASAMLSALVVKASLYVLIRFWFDVMPDAAGVAFGQLLGALAVAAMVYGGLRALHAMRLKLLIAWSTVAQLGYVFLLFPLSLAPGAAGHAGAGFSGGVLHALAHAPAKAAMFLAAGLMMRVHGTDTLKALSGTAGSLPIATLAFAIAALSLMGLPPGGGYAAKVQLLNAALTSGQWWWAVALVIGSVLACTYLVRVLLVLYRTTAVPGATPGIAAGQARPAAVGIAGAVGIHEQLIVLVLAGSAVAIGLLAQWPLELIRTGRFVESGILP